MNHSPKTLTRRHLLGAGLYLLAPACVDVDDELGAADTDGLELDAIAASSEPTPEPEAGAEDDAPSAGALAQPDDPNDPVEIANETASAYEGVRRITDFYLSPMYAEAAWASPDSPGCSSTMIGPNLLMTAAHCDADDLPAITARGRVYRERDLGQRLEEDYTCDLLFHTRPETDMAIYHCPPEPGELSLGDRFGWVDFDPTDVQDGQMLFSVFSNEIDNVMPGVAHHLFTYGPVTDTSVESTWANPNTPPGSVITQADQLQNQKQLAIASSLWTNDGASGSAQFDLNTGKVVVGPLSTGLPDTANRTALGIRDFLLFGWIYERESSGCPYTLDDPTGCITENSVNGAYVTSLGLDPTSYEGGYADEDLDMFFDLPADLADLEGENRREHYRLRFSSRRQNRLWSTGPASTIDLPQGRLEFDAGGAGLLGQWVELARHDLLALEPNAWYTVSFDLNSEDGYYRVCTADLTTSCTPWFYDDDQLQRGHTFRLYTVDGSPSLVVQGWNAQGSIESVSVAETSLYGMPGGPGMPFQFGRRVTNDFDSFDERNAWYEPSVGARPHILPDGEGAGVNWAGWLHQVDDEAGVGYDLAIDTLPFVPSDEEHTICWAHRRDPSEVWNSALGYMRVEHHDGSFVADALFDPGLGWGDTCKSFTAALSTGEGLQVRFGIFGLGPHSGAAFIDSVEVRLPN